MKTSIWTLILGILMIAAGIYALLNPFPASLAAVVVAAWAFMILGVLQIVAALRETGGWQRIALILLGAVMVWLGITLRGNLLEGLVALTMVVALSFVASGIVKLFFGWAIRSMGMGIWVILSGVFSVAIGIMLLGNILGSAPGVLGVLLGIELLSDGIASVALWLHGRKA